MPKVYSPEIGYVEIPEKPMRIISLSSSVTETIFFLGAGGRLVGVDAWSYKPREALEIKRVGSYTHINIDLVKELNPDLIITTTGIQRPLVQKLTSYGFPVYPVPVPVSIYDILNNIIIVGGLIGEYERAHELSQSLLNRIFVLREKFSFERRFKVYIEIDLGGPTIPGYFSHITSALKIFGLDNIFSDSKQSYLYGFRVGDFPVLDLSEVVRRDPDIIIYESKSKKPSIEELLEIIRKRDWSNIKAVKENKLIVMPNDSLAHYGPSFFNELESLLEKIKSIL